MAHGYVPVVELWRLRRFDLHHPVALGGEIRVSGGSPIPRFFVR